MDGTVFQFMTSDTLLSLPVRVWAVGAGDGRGRISRMRRERGAQTSSAEGGGGQRRGHGTARCRAWHTSARTLGRSGCTCLPPHRIESKPDTGSVTPAA